MQNALRDRCVELIESLGIGQAKDVKEVTPLTGGVASDIARVVIGDRQLCIKFALPKLKVAANWQAPVHRNAAEYSWLQVAQSICPEKAIKLYGKSESLYGFAMEYVTGDDVYLWKTELLAGKPDKGEAARVGDMLGYIHAASAKADFDRTPFQNIEDFHALRIEPYLLYTAKARQEVSAPLNTLADVLYKGDKVLIHGDVSPKNILFRDSGPVIMDAECATMGDAAFDPSFCLNHLAIKALHVPAIRDNLSGAIKSFWNSYLKHVNWEPTDELETRVCQLLPALMLARVDGKSPVEYLKNHERDAIRSIAIHLIKIPARTLDDFTLQFSKLLKDR